MRVGVGSGGGVARAGRRFGWCVIRQQELIVGIGGWRVGCVWWVWYLREG